MKSTISRIQGYSRIWLNLVFGPAAISLLAIMITNSATGQSIPLWLWIITLAFIIFAILAYIVGHTTLLHGILNNLSNSLRARSFRRPYVLIIDGTLVNDPNQAAPNPIHTDRTPSDWRTALNAFNWRVELGPVSVIVRENPPDIILNPFGEIYPEEDFVSNKTINEIRQYVWNGGIYVNVAGIPFWYRYDPRSGHMETAGRVEGVFEKQAVWRSLFSDYFPNLTPQGEPEAVESFQTEEGKSRFGDISSAGSNNTLGRFRAYPLNPAQLLPMLRAADGTQCLIGVQLYGKGAFIFSGVFIQSDNNSFYKVIAAIKGWAFYESNKRNP